MLIAVGLVEVEYSIAVVARTARSRSILLKKWESGKRYTRLQCLYRGGPIAARTV